MKEDIRISSLRLLLITVCVIPKFYFKFASISSSLMQDGGTMDGSSRCIALVICMDERKAGATSLLEPSAEGGTMNEQVHKSLNGQATVVMLSDDF